MELIIGEKIFLRKSFIEVYNPPTDDKIAEVIDIDNYSIGLRFGDSSEWHCAVEATKRKEYFYKNNNLNDEFIDLLINCEIELKSISAVTTDNKIINLEIPH